MRGFFGIGVEHPKTKENYGTLFRSAHIFGASFMFIIGTRFRPQCTDTMRSERHVPVYEYDNFDMFYDMIPLGSHLIGIELRLDATPLTEFEHPERATYLLGAEDWGLSDRAVERCESIIVLPGIHSMNVAVAGSIVMYDRVAKAAARK